MSISLSSLSLFFRDTSNTKSICLRPCRRKIIFSTKSIFTSPAAENRLSMVIDSRLLLYGSAAKLCSRFSGLKNWIVENLNLRQLQRKQEQEKEFKSLQFQDEEKSTENLETTPSQDEQSKGACTINLTNDSTFSSFPSDQMMKTTSQYEESSASNYQPDISARKSTSVKSHSSSLQSDSSGRPPSLCIAVIGATGQLATRKIFPALFALYYSGSLPEDVAIFGYSRRKLTDEDLRSIIASTLTCRLDYQQDCGSKMDEFLSRTYYINGGYDNTEGMSMLNARMVQIEGESKANRIFYLSVPQEALVDVASSLADNAQTHKGWNRAIIEKPFGFDSLTSHRLTQSLLAKLKENQLYRIDHLLGRNIIENITVLRFSNLVFQPLWNRTYIHNVQVILSEDLGIQTRGRYFNGYGLIRDVVHSHLLQTIALLAMESPVSFDGEDIRNEKVKVLRSIRELERTDVVLGQYNDCSEDKVDDALVNSSTPTFFAAALHIENARWDGVPFLIKAGMGLSKHRVEIRIQFRHVPGNLYRNHITHNADLATNELILRDLADEAILVRVNNKIPGLCLSLDASELNLLYKDKYSEEVPDSYEHLLHDVMDGDNHLFMRSDEVAAAWDILTPVLRDIDENNIAPEPYELGSMGPVKASQLWAKHGV